MLIEAINHEFGRLLSKLGYLSDEERDQLREAYHHAAEMHQDQKRNSGEPYISHPVRVAVILAEYSPDYPTLAAALLHDVIEDSHTTHADLARLFGKDVANIVEGVSKLTFQKEHSYRAKQAENFQKMALAMAKDLRVIFIKLADRLHNMRTVHHMRPDKAKRIARETMHVYAPLAHRMGINAIYAELEDLAFKTIYPLRYNMIVKAVEKRRIKNKDYIQETITMLSDMLKKHGIEGRVEGRQKHYAGIYYKMASGLADGTDHYYQEQQERRRNSSFTDIMDVHGFRVIVRGTDACYRALGLAHQLFRPLPGRFKDYIAVPKSNGYQSLHTTVLGLKNYPIEVQIRTELMHEMSIKGLAAHWRYKKGKDTGATSQLDRWLNEIPAWTDASGSPEDFFRHMRVDLTPTEVYVFSRDGDIIALPRGATPVDFAYAIHTDVGNHCIGCLIDSREAPLSTRLKSGQQITILTNKHASPNMAWRSFVVTGRALSALGVYLRHQKRNDSVLLGRALLGDELKKHDTNLNAVSNTEISDYLNRHKQPHFDYVLERIGMGKILANNVADELLHTGPRSNTEHPEILINQENAGKLSFGKCCRPVYGDNVIALLRTDTGIVIHRRGCANVRKLLRDPNRCAFAYWDPHTDVPLPISIRLETANARPMVSAIASTINALEGGILTLDATEKDAKTQVLSFEVLVKNRQHLSRLLRKLRRLADIYHVSRGR